MVNDEEVRYYTPSITRRLIEEFCRLTDPRRPHTRTR